MKEFSSEKLFWPDKSTLRLGFDFNSCIESSDDWTYFLNKSLCMILWPFKRKWIRLWKFPVFRGQIVSFFAFFYSIISFRFTYIFNYLSTHLDPLFVAFSIEIGGETQVKDYPSYHQCYLENDIIQFFYSIHSLARRFSNTSLILYALCIFLFARYYMIYLFFLVLINHLARLNSL